MPLNPYLDPSYNPLLELTGQAQSSALGSLSPEEQDSLLSKIGSGALSGLGYVGGSLNKAFGGRAVRGALGGNFDELASIIPFSDAMGITDPSREVTGAQLLGGDHNTPLLSMEGLGGLGLEIATDPSTWFGGAMLKGAAKGAGALGRAATKIPKIGPGIEAAGNIASDLYTKTIPPLFQGAVMGRTTEQGQKIARSVTEALPELYSEAMGHAIPFAESVKDSGITHGALRDLFENAAKPASATESAVIDPIRQYLDQMVSKETAHGLPSEFLGSQQIPSGPAAGEKLGYFPRRMTPKEASGFGEWWKSKAPLIDEMPGRQEHLQRLTTNQLNEISKVDLSHLHPNDVPGVIAEKYLGVDKNMDAHINQLQKTWASTNAPADLQKLTEAEAYRATLREQAGVLARQKLAGTLPEFLNQPVKDFFTRDVEHLTNMRKAEELYKGLAEIATDASTMPGGVPIVKALEAAGLTNTGGVNGMILQELQKVGKASGGVTDLANLMVDPEVAADVAGFMRASGVEGLQQVKKVWDSITNINKAYQTVLWPANHARNQMTAMFQNFVHGASDASLSGPMAYVQPWLDAHAWKNGDVIAGLESKIPTFKGMTNAEANKALAKEILQFDVTKNAAKLHNFELAEPVARSAKQLESFIPGSDKRGLLTSLTDAGWGDVDKLKNPLGVSGVMGSTVDSFPPILAGRQVASTLDDINRVSTYIAKRTQGLDPLDALKATTRTHYDFSNLSQFERQYMRRMFPFYGWMRQNVPAVMTELLEKPGGRMAQGIRVANELGGQEQGFQPDYLGSGVAAKMGAESPAGMQTYLSSTGLPFEDLGNFTSAQGLLGSLNPLLKGPLEMATNRQFFTGRDLTGTVPHTGSYAGDQLLSASPLGRVTTTGRMLLDTERGDLMTKALNLGTGVRTTDVDMNAARRMAIKQAAEDLLLGTQGVGSFARMYVRPENLPQLTPDQLAIYRLYQSAQTRQSPQNPLSR